MIQPQKMCAIIRKCTHAHRNQRSSAVHALLEQSHCPAFTAPFISTLFDCKRSPSRDRLNRRKRGSSSQQCSSQPHVLADINQQIINHTQMFQEMTVAGWFIDQKEQPIKHISAPCEHRDIVEHHGHMRGFALR